MAEARQAVGFRLGVTPEGNIDFQLDNDVLDLIIKAFKRAWKKSSARLLTNFKNGLFPVKIDMFLANAILLTAVLLADYDPTFGIIQTLVSWLGLNEGWLWCISCILSGFILTFMGTQMIRFSLRLAFSYQKWMFLSREQMKKPPLHFKLWSLMVQILCSIRKLGRKSNTGKPLLCAYQGALPTLPLPSVKDTLKRHLASIEPLTDAAEYQKFVQLSQEFESTIGNRLQRWLLLKWITSDNYVSDWWEEYVYLRGRSPIMINSNYYSLDSIVKCPTSDQAARAGNVVHLAFQFRRQLQKQELTPIILQNVVPMCSNQYERFFNTSRIPGVEGDTLLHMKDSTYVVVMHKGRFFRLCCYNKGRLLNSAELQRQIQGILDDPSQPDEGESHLAALTASNRTQWAHARAQFFAKGLNQASLDIIDKAAFVVVLDEVAYDSDPDSDGLSQFGAAMLHGSGSNRWFDKSFQLIIGKNGRIGLNGEHSWADAPIVGHFWEFVVCKDVLGNAYDGEGNCYGNINDIPPKSRKLRWEIPHECQTMIESCRREAQILISDLHLHILRHDAYGKGFMKKCKLSPDAYIQMAMQLAYFRDAGKFCLTYEASMTRLFKEGRTETVRPCTMDAVEWARAMDNPSLMAEEKIKLLQKACLRHQKGYQEAMTGKGIDRHLFALYVVSKYLDVESEYLKKVLSEPWRLSTSQTPVRGEFADLKRASECISAGGGFGPVADDGYGVSYIIVGEDCIFFHVSAKKSCPGTDAYRFAKRIETALADIRKMHENQENANNLK